MSKRIAIFMDGTWNDRDDQTNVFRAKENVAPFAADGVVQLALYEPGVGTKWSERLRGGIFGFGLDRNVANAYRLLLQNHAEGDEIFLFGFSRGAFTARSLAGMVIKCGLARSSDEATVRRLWDHYRNAETRRLQEIAHSLKHPEDPDSRPPDADESWLLASSRQIRIKFIGVWDTVGSLGIPFGNIPGLSRRDFQFHNTRPSVYVEHGYHAVAIDEQRKDFAPTLWEYFAPRADDSGRPSKPHPGIEQRWFTGAHSNVGGGIAGSSMSQVALDWMMRCAARHGLAAKAPVRLDGGEALGPVDPSFRKFAFGLYRLLRLFKPFHREIGRAALEKTARDGTVGLLSPISETIDGSVFARWRSDAAYRPEPLRRWAASRGVDPAALTGAVLAHDGGPAAD
jgi:uncharacterized protein (DUF2235 family)